MLVKQLQSVLSIDFHQCKLGVKHLLIDPVLSCCAEG